MNLNQFMQNGVMDILKTAGRYSLANAKGRAFLGRMAPQLLKSAATRERHEKNGQHIPPFLIASVASQCNLRCAGCYARAGGGCSQSAAQDDLTDAQWHRIFLEAADVGISFILLAGGEPLMRRDILDRAAQCKSIIFPIFTNGTLLDDAYITLFDENRHLIPVMSIEGNETATDLRRGTGVYGSILTAMDALAERKILFGASITVTRENMAAVTDSQFIQDLRTKGCGVLIYVEYVPAEKGTEHLALASEEMRALQACMAVRKAEFSDMVILSFPGDEAAMGGCLASGRGFFHINAQGGAEPCPFSPFAGLNLRTASILEVLASDYFASLRGLAMAQGPHTGGCVLFEQESAVRTLLARHSGC